MSGPVLDGLYDQKWYNGEPLTSDQYGYVLFENKILGLPRLRQLRVKEIKKNFLILFCSFKVTNHSCVVHKKFQSIIPECYGPYSSSRENRTTYTPDNDTVTPTA